MPLRIRNPSRKALEASKPKPKIARKARSGNASRRGGAVARDVISQQEMTERDLQGDDEDPAQEEGEIEPAPAPTPTPPPEPVPEPTPEPEPRPVVIQMTTLYENEVITNDARPFSSISEFGFYSERHKETAKVAKLAGKKGYNYVLAGATAHLSHEKIRKAPKVVDLMKFAGWSNVEKFVDMFYNSSKSDIEIEIKLVFTQKRPSSVTDSEKKMPSPEKVARKKQVIRCSSRSSTVKLTICQQKTQELSKATQEGFETAAAVRDLKRETGQAARLLDELMTKYKCLNRGCKNRGHQCALFDKHKHYPLSIHDIKEWVAAIIAHKATVGQAPMRLIDRKRQELGPAREFAVPGQAYPPLPPPPMPNAEQPMASQSNYYQPAAPQQGAICSWPSYNLAYYHPPSYPHYGALNYPTYLPYPASATQPAHAAYPPLPAQTAQPPYIPPPTQTTQPPYLPAPAQARQAAYPPTPAQATQSDYPAPSEQAIQVPYPEQLAYHPQPKQRANPAPAAQKPLSPYTTQAAQRAFYYHQRGYTPALLPRPEPNYWDRRALASGWRQPEKPLQSLEEAEWPRLPKSRPNSADDIAAERSPTLEQNYNTYEDTEDTLWEEYQNSFYDSENANDLVLNSAMGDTNELIELPTCPYTSGSQLFAQNSEPDYTFEVDPITILSSEMDALCPPLQADPAERRL